MAESGKEIIRDIEIDRVEEFDEEKEENGELMSHSELPKTSLAELNMLIVFLSLFYFSNDDCKEFEESEEIVRDQVAATQTCISRLQNKRSREKHEPKLGRRSFSHRFQTTIRDSRHGRKM